MIDYVIKIIRKINRVYIHSIWQKAKHGDINGLDEEERHIAKILLEHSEEFFNQFEFADTLSDYNFDPSEVNPFLHIAIHAIVERQVEERNPVEAFQFYNSMLRKKCTRHEAIHLLGLILFKFLHPFLKGEGKISPKEYCDLLKLYKFKKPEKIYKLLEEEDILTPESENSHINREIFNEIQKCLDNRKGLKNREPDSASFGLSPEQIYRLMINPLGENNDIVTINRELSKQDLIDVPIVEETSYFLNRVAELQPIKATGKGNLPLKFAHELYEKFPERSTIFYPIRSEAEASKLISFRYVMEMAGWIKKRNQKFSLTQKGERLVRNGFNGKDFFHLFKTYTLKFNWASRDLYPSLDIIQDSFLFSCYLLSKKARIYISNDELSHLFIKAFPAVLKIGEENDVSKAFSLRFLERFCEYFGLVEIKRENDPYKWFNYSVKITPLFEKFFQFK